MASKARERAAANGPKWAEGNALAARDKACLSPTRPRPLERRDEDRAHERPEPRNALSRSPQISPRGTNLGATRVKKRRAPLDCGWLKAV